MDSNIRELVEDVTAFCCMFYNGSVACSVRVLDWGRFEHHWYNGSLHEFQLEKSVLDNVANLSDFTCFDVNLGGIDYYKADIRKTLAYFIFRDYLPEGDYIVQCA